MNRKELIESLTTEELQKAYDEKMNSLKTVETFSEDDFWKIIDEMNYIEDLNYERIRKNLIDLKYGNKQTIKEFRNIFSNLYSKLENNMDKQIEENDLDYEKIIGLGDSGLSDLLSHIIGIGKIDYYKNFNDVKELSKHANGKFGSVDGYSESFNYIFS